MSRGRGYLIAAVILVGAAALAVLLVSLAPEPERRDPPSPVPYVETAAAIAGSGGIPVHGAGTVRPSAEIDIAAQVGGRVVWVNPAFRSGRRVAAGDVLFRIEEEDYVYRLRDAEATFAARRAELLEAQEQAAIARAAYERYAEETDAAAERASPLALHEPQLEAAQAALDRDEARVAAAALALSRTRVQAPFDGFVREEGVSTGQIVGPGETVGRLFAADAVEVVVPLSDANAALIANLWADGEDDASGAAVRVIAVYGENRFAWRGRVDRAEASLDDETRTIDVVVRVSEPFSPGTRIAPDAPAAPSSGLDGPPLLVGKFVEVEIAGRAPTNYYRVRRAGLQPGNQVWAIADDGTVRIVPVRVLQRANDEVYVTGALQNGQEIVVSGIQFATDGMAVRTGAAPAR